MPLPDVYQPDQFTTCVWDECLAFITEMLGTPGEDHRGLPEWRVKVGDIEVEVTLVLTSDPSQPHEWHPTVSLGDGVSIEIPWSYPSLAEEKDEYREVVRQTIGLVAEIEQQLIAS